MATKLIVRYSAVLAFGLFAVQIFLFPLPQFALRTLVNWSSGWILSDYTKSDGAFPGVTTPIRKVFTTLIEHSLIRQFESRLSISSNASDIDRLIIVLGALKGLIINQQVIIHTPLNRPIFLSGLGWCDQLNGVAGILLAKNFPISQSFSLFDSVNKVSPHTIGRVFSLDYNDWIYYDVFYDEIVLFTRDVNNDVKYIAKFNPLRSAQNLPLKDDELTFLYGMDGWILNEYSQTFGGYLVKKTLQAIKNRNLNSLNSPAQKEPFYAMSTVQGNGVNGNMQNTDTSIPENFFDIYLNARLAHIFGDNQKAKDKYMEFINMADSAIQIKKSPLAQASYLFQRGLMN
jgi:hypothetical protein